MLKAVCQNTLLFHSHRKITARFDGGSLTSDAGWLLFGSLDRQHRLCEGFSSCISESRDPLGSFMTVEVDSTTSLADRGYGL